MPRALRRRLPLVVLVIGFAISLLSAAALYRAEQGRQEARFAALADGAAGAVQARMLAQLTLLRGTAGFFNASTTVDQAEFRTFVERLRLDRDYPGVLGIGFAAYGADRAVLVDAAKRVGRGADFRPWPDKGRGIRSAILLLEPLDRLNRAALGYDMLSEPVRRSAMIGAARDRTARMSGRLSLVQEIDPVKQPGFIFYLPIRDDAPGGGDGLRGWAFSPLRAWDLFGAIFAGRSLDGGVVEVFDGTADAAHLLYRSGPAVRDPAQRMVRPIDVSGRPWILRLSNAREPGGWALAAGIAAAGVLISLLFAILLLQQDRAASRVEQQVAERTAELSAANARLRAEAGAREAAEDQVRQMQKMEAIGQLTGGIAHDFNNMLAVVIGNLELAARRVGDPERVGRAIAGARTGAERAAELTQRLLAYGRRQPLAPRTVAPNALIEGMTDLLRRTLGGAIELTSRLGHGIWPVHVDPVQLESAILNIAINGRDAMPGGGKLEIKTANRIMGREESGGAPPPGDDVLIAIADTGHGMEEAVAARALEPFFTTKEVGKGTGLGLSQVYGFVTQSGGHFGLVTAPGGGTRVELYLPRCRDPLPKAADARAPDEAVEAGRAGETILVVEDEARVRAMSVEALRELGYDVLAAEGGEEAIALLERHDAISLVFTDMVMPGMNGRQLAEIIGRRWPDLPILFTTGFAREAGAQSGEAITVLHKPFTTAQLARRIRAALDG
jgi:signal transduction histidine kinase/CheY-like chemotaxis protein